MFVRIFCGIDDGVELSLGCGNGFGSRSSDMSVGSLWLVLLHRWEVGVASSEEIRGVMCDDDNLVMGGPVWEVLSARALHIASTKLAIRIGAAVLPT